MLRHLHMPTLNKLLFNTDPNVVTEGLINEINRTLDIVAPFKTIQIRKNYAQHLSSTTKELMVTRDLAKQKAQNSKSTTDTTEYKKLRNQVVKNLRNDKKEWAKNLLERQGNTSRNLWNTIKKISGDEKSKNINHMKINDVVVTNQTEIANALNTHFVSKVEKLVKEMPTPSEDLLDILTNTPTPDGPEMKLMSITEYQLQKCINKMKKNPSSGSDSISGLVIHDLFESIKRILLHSINLSLTGYL